MQQEEINNNGTCLDFLLLSEKSRESCIDFYRCRRFLSQISLQDNLMSLKSKHLKVPLRQGRGLMDWVKLSNNKDLSGTGGRLKKVTEDELAKHCTQDDCWMIVHGSLSSLF